MVSFAENLLSWYQTHKRSLPWRDESNPYRIWLAEVMLQQTQVKTVIPYYHRWLEKFPDVFSVACARQDEVLKKWEGLGYYSRCRNFHKACQVVADRYKGKIPQHWKEFRDLPGVGDYTAAAVLSFAFNQPYPLLDGNVNRVMARLLAFPESMKKGKKKFLSHLSKWLDPQRAGDFNQAMMELGSLICRKNQPHCTECPVSHYCKGYKDGNPEQFPIQDRKRPRPHYTIVAGIIWNKDKFLIRQRPVNALLGGLWEFPGGKVGKQEHLESALVREIQEETGLVVKPLAKIDEIHHAYTHFTITLHGFHCVVVNNHDFAEDTSSRKWIAPEEIGNYAFPKANHKLFNKLNQNHWKY